MRCHGGFRDGECVCLSNISRTVEGMGNKQYDAGTILKLGYAIRGG